MPSFYPRYFSQSITVFGRSTFPPSASINVYLWFKSAIAISSKRAIALSPIRVHPRVSAVQKCDRPFVKKSDRPSPHPRPSAYICGSKERSAFPPSASISVHLRFKSAIGRCVKKSDRPFPHPRPSACICGSKERSALPFLTKTQHAQPFLQACILHKSKLDLQ